MKKKENSKSSPKNTQIKIALVIFALGIVCALASVAAWIFINRNTPEEKSSEQESSAILVAVKPDIEVSRNGEITTVSEGEHDLFSGDSIKTNSSGTGYIIFADNSTVSL